MKLNANQKSSDMKSDMLEETQRMAEEQHMIFCFLMAPAKFNSE